MEKQKLILDFISQELLDQSEAITPATPLFTKNLLDSMDLAELIEFLETKFPIKVNPMDIVVENLDSVDNILSFLDRKQAANAEDWEDEYTRFRRQYQSIGEELGETPHWDYPQHQQLIAVSGARKNHFRWQNRTIGT